MGNTDPDWCRIYARRREAARELMLKRGLDALLVCAAPNRFYLSGFELHDGQPGETAGMILLCADGNDWLATDGRYLDAARRLWDNRRIYIYTRKMTHDLANLLRRNGSLIGVESESVSYGFFQRLQQNCRYFPMLVECNGIVEKLREIKAPQEIEALEESFRLNERMFQWLGKRVADQSLTGVSEADLAWDIEKYFRDNGAQSLAFSTIAATSINGALPHAIPGSQTIREDSPLLVDAGCRVANYCSDQTRSWWYGSHPSPEFQRTLSLVKKAQQAALDFMKPGVCCADVYAAAYKVFTEAGVEDAFTHGLGHGVGLQTHEAPTLSPHSAQVLKAGMVVTVEPGLYYPHWGGVRWEHTVLIEEKGIRILGCQGSGEKC